MSVWYEYGNQIKSNPETWKVSYMITAENSEKAEKVLKGFLRDAGRRKIAIKESKQKRTYNVNEYGHAYYRINAQYER